MIELIQEDIRGERTALDERCIGAIRKGNRDA